MKGFVAVVLVLAIAGGGWFGWNKYQGSQETGFAVQAIQSTAAQTERQIKAKDEDGITFAEYFKRATASIESLDQTIAGLDTRAWAHKPADRDTAIAFIEQCKALIRAEQARTRLMMDENDARKSADAAKKELDEADSTVALEWALKKYKREGGELIAVLQKQITNAEESSAKIARMVAADDAVKAAFGADKGLTQATADSLKKSIASVESQAPAKG